MKTAFIVIQIILSLTLTVLIFLQSGGDSESKNNLLSTTVYEKRGWEKALFNFTTFLLALFIISSIIQTII